eukprot:TRINITY_DN6077_c0_g1_i1.p1 TRINITY_DN6077_c0_g1~~TRINITY_DN6077_c0_g1_i1.p1  ORF type:complete len:191 (-),score=42.36 TRINITY_DN6077_c0_g1_i1:97-669(-)
MNSAKHFGALLTTIVNALFMEGGSEASLAPATVHAEVYSDTDLTVEVVANLINVISNILKKAAYEDLELDAFETLVQSAGQSSLTPGLQDLLVKYWRTQRSKIHEQVYKKVTWNNSLHKVAWRIDVKTKSKSGAEMNEPTAIVEVSVNPKFQSASNSGSRLVRFEMDKEQLSQTLRDINNIQQLLVARTI